MKYFVFLFAIVAWGSLGLIIGKGVAGTWREESNDCVKGCSQKGLLKNGIKLR